MCIYLQQNYKAFYNIKEPTRLQRFTEHSRGGDVYYYISLITNETDHLVNSFEACFITYCKIKFRITYHYVLLYTLLTTMILYETTS